MRHTKRFTKKEEKDALKLESQKYQNKWKVSKKTPWEHVDANANSDANELCDSLDL